MAHFFRYFNTYFKINYFDPYITSYISTLTFGGFLLFKNNNNKSIDKYREDIINYGCC
jgi:hypothetical protein